MTLRRRNARSGEREGIRYGAGVAARRRGGRADDVVMDGGAGRTAQEALERGAFGEPDRGRIRRHHPQRRDRQGASARPVRPRQVAVVERFAPAQAAPGGRLSAPSAPPCHSRQYGAGGACPAVRRPGAGPRARAGAPRQCHSDRPALLDPPRKGGRVETGNVASRIVEGALLAPRRTGGPSGTTDEGASRAR